MTLVFLLIALFIVFMLVMTRHNQSEIQRLFDMQELTHGGIHEGTQINAPESIDFSSIQTLPEPVQQYFRYVLGKHQQIIQRAEFRQTGFLKIKPAAENWTAFTARQSVAVDTSSFVWDAKIRLPLGLRLRVVDSLLQGVASANVSFLSAITLAKETDRYEMNSAALYRFLAEAVWHPTSLLPQSGVRWQAVDDSRAIATISASDITVSLEFRFNDTGEVTGIYTEDRYGNFSGQYIKYPWEGHFSDYTEVNGMMIPSKGEVGWHLDEGWWLFWKGDVYQVEYQY